VKEYNGKSYENIKAVQFSPIVEKEKQHNEHHLGFITDVSLELVVELGRVEKNVREILEFKPGTIMKINKLAGEHADVLINNTPIAEAEVVVVDENFAIRITDIISKREMEKNLT
jgi:flagellar motor switch protein FliN/FliY